tara:strand:+ start:4981 stop:6510 length:1530 start_codon:yes stop_codon:yes gene_type:complete
MSKSTEQPAWVLDLASQLASWFADNPQAGRGSLQKELFSHTNRTWSDYKARRLLDFVRGRPSDWKGKPVSAAPTPISSDDEVPGEAPSDDTAHTDMGEGRHLFEWTDAGVRRSVVLTESSLRDMIRDYVATSEGGAGKSMQQVAVRHGLTRRDFWRIKSAYGLTKQHEPFTRNDMVEEPLEVLVQGSLALKRRALAERVERESLQDLRRLATKWLRLESGLLDPLRDIMQDVVGELPPASNFPDTPDPDNHIVFFQPSDLHFGLHVEAGAGFMRRGYDRVEAARRFRHGIAEAVKHGEAAFGKPDYLLLGVGGDAAHIDNMQGATTSNKHTQDMDGRPDTLPRELVSLYIDVVQYLLEKDIKVHMECIPGNHDEMLSRALMASLWAAYRNDDRVTFGNFSASYAMHMYGSTLILGHHGHGERSAVDLASTADAWLREMGRNARHRIALTGNLHHLKVHEDSGIMLIQQPSPAESDAWHEGNGYVDSRPACISAYISPTDGLLDLRYIGF